jgi:hypothetical protein
MSRRFKTIWVAAAALIVAACASAPFKSTWRAPNEGPFSRISGQKIVALYLSDTEATRRNAEDALAEEIKARGGKGITS